MRITEHDWPQGTRPLVSIISWVYNHERFLRDAIEGILMQETTFPVEITLHDDASTDGSVRIIKDYEARHPRVFRNILRRENLWLRGINCAAEVFGRASGEFIALCEGDDYWTHPRKLQRQVEALEAAPDCAAVAHWVEDEGADGRREPPPAASRRDWPGSFISAADLIEQNVITTCSVVFRRAMSPRPTPSISGLPMGDWPMWVRMALAAPILCLPERMAVYRVHGGGAWSGLPPVSQLAGAASLMAALWPELPENLTPVATRSFARFVRMAATQCTGAQECEEFAECIGRLRQELLAAGLPPVLPPMLERELSLVVEDVAASALVHRANKAWEGGNFALARRLFGELASRRGGEWSVRMKRLLASAGPVGLLAKRAFSNLQSAGR